MIKLFDFHPVYVVKEKHASTPGMHNLHIYTAKSTVLSGAWCYGELEEAPEVMVTKRQQGTPEIQSAWVEVGEGPSCVGLEPEYRALWVTPLQSSTGSWRRDEKVGVEPACWLRRRTYGPPQMC